MPFGVDKDSVAVRARRHDLVRAGPAVDDLVKPESVGGDANAGRVIGAYRNGAGIRDRGRGGRSPGVAAERAGQPVICSVSGLVTAETVAPVQNADAVPIVAGRRLRRDGAGVRDLRVAAAPVVHHDAEFRRMDRRRAGDRLGGGVGRAINEHVDAEFLHRRCRHADHHVASKVHRRRIGGVAELKDGDASVVEAAGEAVGALGDCHTGRARARAGVQGDGARPGGRLHGGPDDDAAREAAGGGGGAGNLRRRAARDGERDIAGDAAVVPAVAHIVADAAIGGGVGLIRTSCGAAAQRPALVSLRLRLAAGECQNGQADRRRKKRAAKEGFHSTPPPRANSGEPDPSNLRS